MELPKKALVEMLEENGKYTDSGDFKPMKLAHHAADGALFGTPASCPACGNNALSLNPFLDLLACDGDSGFARCTWTGPSSAIHRTPSWIVTKKCGGKKSPLKAPYDHPGFGVAAVPELVYAGTKPSAAAGGGKKRKAGGTGGAGAGAGAGAGDSSGMDVAIDDDGASGGGGGGGGAAAGPAAATGAPTGVADGDELNSMAFYLQGRFNGGRGAQMAEIQAYGGSIALVAATATHILVSDTNGAKPDPSKPLARLMSTEEGAMLPIVAVAFIKTLIARDPAFGGVELRSPAGLSASGLLLFGSSAGADLPAPSSAKPQPDAKRSKTSAASGGGGSAAADARKFAPAELEVDTEAGYVVGADIVKTDCGTDVFNVMLHKITHQDNKYYKLQLIATGGSYVLFAKWGAVGRQSINVNTKHFVSAEDGKKQFCKKFKECTGNTFDPKVEFKKKSSRYESYESYYQGVGVFSCVCTHAARLYCTDSADESVCERRNPRAWRPRLHSAICMTFLLFYIPMNLRMTS